MTSPTGRRQPTSFGAVKHSGIDPDDAAKSAPRSAGGTRSAGSARTTSTARTSKSTSAAGGGLVFSTRWSDETMALAKAAHVVDRIDDPNAVPKAFNGWVTIAVQMWARLSPQRRAQERDRMTFPPATKNASRPRQFSLPEGARIALEEAMRADELIGHLEGRGTFVTHAVLYAAAAAASRNGGDLTIKPS